MSDTLTIILGIGSAQVYINGVLSALVDQFEDGFIVIHNNHSASFMNFDEALMHATTVAQKENDDGYFDF